MLLFLNLLQISHNNLLSEYTTKDRLFIILMTISLIKQNPHSDHLFKSLVQTSALADQI